VGLGVVGLEVEGLAELLGRLLRTLQVEERDAEVDVGLVLQRGFGG